MFPGLERLRVPLFRVRLLVPSFISLRIPSNGDDLDPLGFPRIMKLLFPNDPRGYEKLFIGKSEMTKINRHCCLSLLR